LVFDFSLVQTLGLIVVAATAAALLARPLRVPTIVAFLLAGVVLGPLLGLLESDYAPGHDAPVDLIAELGIVLLLFLVGLELSFAKIRDVGKVAVVAGLGQVVFTAAGGFVLAWLLGFAVVPALFLAVALTFSSTVVVVKVLDQKGELDSLYGRIAVGIFLVQDLVVIIMLTVLTGLGSAQTMDVVSIAWGVGRAFVGMSLMLAIALIAARFVLPRPMAWAARSGWTLVVWSLALCLGFVELADVLGLSHEIGAFLAGLSLAQLHASEDLRRRIHPLMDFFVAVFFVTLGAQMQFDAAVRQGWAALTLSLFVLIGNPFIFMWIIARFGYSERTSFKTSVTVAQISEFSFVFAALGMTTGLIDQSILSLTALVGLITIIASVYMILYSDALYGLCRGLGLLKMFRAVGEAQAAATREPEPAEGRLRGHVVVVGMNALGQQLARRLHQRGETVLAIDTDPHKLADVPGRTLVGDVRYLSVLREANLAEAKLAITALKIEDTNLMFVYRCQYFGVAVAVHGFDREVLDELHQQGPTYVMDAKQASDAQIEKMLQQPGWMPAC
jgi:Kef-type K+ transport system membrane component KefB